MHVGRVTELDPDAHISIFCVLMTRQAFAVSQRGSFDNRLAKSVRHSNGEARVGSILIGQAERSAIIF